MVLSGAPSFCGAALCRGLRHATRPSNGRHTRFSRCRRLASGRAHDRATWLLCLPFGALWWPWLGMVGMTVASVSFLAGGLLLSPDLDTRSNPTRRWGPLRLLWWPYRSLLSHRSFVSHTPLIGSAGRLLYLAVVLLLLCLIGRPLGTPSPAQMLLALQGLWMQQPALLFTALVGVEASAWLHLIQDGDPLPRTPRLLRPLLRPLLHRHGRRRQRR